MGLFAGAVDAADASAESHLRAVLPLSRGPDDDCSGWGYGRARAHEGRPRLRLRPRGGPEDVVLHKRLRQPVVFARLGLRLVVHTGLGLRGYRRGPALRRGLHRLRDAAINVRDQAKYQSAVSGYAGGCSCPGIPIGCNAGTCGIATFPLPSDAGSLHDAPDTCAPSGCTGSDDAGTD